MTDLVSIASPDFTVTVSALGAELQSVTDAGGGEWLWDGDARWWTGRAPLLFPSVGVSAHDTIRIDGTGYTLPKHGFARKKPFTLVDRSESAVTYRLEPDEATRAAYPFAFRLDVTHSLDGATLTTVAEVFNDGDVPMPAGFGFHPALRWPLPGTSAESRYDHVVRFDAEETGPLREISTDGLFLPSPRATPVQGNVLHLHDDLFTRDALVWDGPQSRGLIYGLPGGPGIRADFAGMPRLGIWTKPGAGYVCIEPWHSRADDEGYAGEFADRPGVVTIAPGESHRFEMALTFGVTVG